jgi:hypothetical protein
MIKNLSITILIFTVISGINCFSQETQDQTKVTKADLKNPNQYIKEYVEHQINSWQKKGEFEKTARYQKRVTPENRKKKIKEFEKEAVRKLKEYRKETINWDSLKLKKYDADNETYLVSSDKTGAIILPVPIDEAPSLKKYWDKVQTQKHEFYFNGENFELRKMEFINPVNGKKYVYNSEETVQYTTKQIDYNFNEIQVDTLKVEKNRKKKASISQSTMKVGKPEVDVQIPQTNEKRSNYFAVIIGNEDYQSYQTDLKAEQNVEFAKNDAEIFKKYCRETIGIPADNILFEVNAGVVKMKQTINQINSVIKHKEGKAVVLFYYAGHGFPHPKTNEPHIIPVDVTATQLDLAISLKDLYKKLTEYPSEKVIVFMDACFSGGGRETGLMASRGVKIEPKDTRLDGNIVVFSASNKEQSALPYRKKRHGIFTYYLLKKLQKTRGEVKLGELYNYIHENVSVRSPIINQKEQTPEVNSSYKVNKEWKKWYLKK